VGESVEDLLPFSIDEYLDGILGDAPGIGASESR
jgi:hypothetical protein